MDAEEEKGKGKGLNFGCGQQLLFFASATALVAAAVGLLTGEPSAAELARYNLQVERAKAIQPWTIALGVTVRVLAIVAGLTLVWALTAAVRAAVHWLDTQARLIRPDPQTGQFPAVKVRRGEVLIDLNRLPDGKAMTGVFGGRTALLLTLFFQHVLHKDFSELLAQPSIIITPHDTGTEQLQITTQAQAVQALAAVSQRISSQDVQALLPRPRYDRGLPPLLIEDDRLPDEVRLLLDAGRRHWERQSEEMIDG